MDRNYRFNRFDFHEQAPIDEQIEFESHGLRCLRGLLFIQSLIVKRIRRQAEKLLFGHSLARDSMAIGCFEAR